MTYRYRTISFSDSRFSVNNLGSINTKSFVGCRDTISHIAFLTVRKRLQRYKDESVDPIRQIEKEPQQNRFEFVVPAPLRMD